MKRFFPLRIFSLMITAIIICNMSVPVFAETGAGAAANTDSKTESPAAGNSTAAEQGTSDPAASGTAKNPETASPSTTQGSAETALAELPKITSDSYVVMDAKTGQVLISKNYDKKQYPASVTKVMTTALALESGLDPNSKHVIQREDVFQPPDYKKNYENTTLIYITPGEEVTVEDMLYATMVQSANDAAATLANITAEAAGWGVPKEDGGMDYTTGFVNKMNEKAKKLGALNTNFTNPHGLYNEEHYTTAYDMALITRYALGVSTFEKYFSATEYTMQPTNKQSSQRIFARSGEGMMEPTNENYYKGTAGVKLGHTTQSNHTGVSVARNDSNTTLICVALNCTGSNAYAVQHDMVNLLDYCFNNFNPVTFTKEDLAGYAPKTNVYDLRGVPGNVIGYAELYTENDFTILLHKKYNKDDVAITSDIPGHYFEDEDMNSTLTFSLKKAAGNQEDQYMVSPIAALKMKVTVETYEKMRLEKEQKQKELINKILNIVKIICYVIVGIAVFLLILRFINRQRYKKKRKQRKNAQARRKRVQRSGPPPKR